MSRNRGTEMNGDDRPYASEPMGAFEWQIPSW